MLKLDSLLIGEVGVTELIEIKESITSLSIELTNDTISQLKFTVFDETLNMFNSNYFTIGRAVTYQYEKYVIAAVTVTSTSKGYNVTVRARSKATEDMRWTKGNKSFGNISPSIFAKNMAEKYGLKIFAEDSPANGEIRQESNDNNYESIWDVLKRLATDLDFLCFEARGVLFFASMDFIVQNAPVIEVNASPIVSSDSDTFYAANLSLSVNEDAKLPYSGTASLIANDATTSIYPGVVLKFPSLKQFNNIKFMVERVSMTLGSSELVSLSFKSSETPEEAQCLLQDFARGSTGPCVERIQKAVLTIVDGDFGPVTEKAVKAYQKFYGHAETGVVESSSSTETYESSILDGALRPLVYRPDIEALIGETRVANTRYSTWELIVNPPDPPGKYVKQPISGGSTTTETTPSSTGGNGRKIIGYDEEGLPLYEPFANLKPDTYVPYSPIPAPGVNAFT